MLKKSTPPVQMLSRDGYWVCGREGEYKILLSFATLKESEKLKLNEELKNLIDEQNKKNKVVNASSGSISISTNPATANFENCRGQLKELDK